MSSSAFPLLLQLWWINIFKTACFWKVGCPLRKVYKMQHMISVLYIFLDTMQFINTRTTKLWYAGIMIHLWQDTKKYEKICAVAILDLMRSYCMGSSATICGHISIIWIYLSITWDYISVIWELVSQFSCTIFNFCGQTYLTSKYSSIACQTYFAQNYISRWFRMKLHRNCIPS